MLHVNLEDRVTSRGLIIERGRACGAPIQSYVQVVLRFLKGPDVHPPQVGDCKVSIALLPEFETFSSANRCHSVHLKEAERSIPNGGRRFTSALTSFLPACSIAILQEIEYFFIVDLVKA